MKREDGFIAGEQAVTTEASVEHDIVVEDKTTWTKGDIAFIQEDYPGELEATRPRDEVTLQDTTNIREKLDDEIFLEVNKGTAKKSAKLSQVKGHQGNFGRLNSPAELPDSIASSFELYQEDQVAQDKLAAETRARMKRGGELWSAGLSDSELRRTIVESGIIEERERRRKAEANLANHHINLRYSSAVGTQVTDEDPNNRGHSYALAIGYEYMLEHASEKLSSWSIEGLLERGIDYQDLNGSTPINGRIAWGAFGFNVNWFPFYRPSAIRRFIPFVGGGVKRGNGDLQAGSLSQSYDVQMLSSFAHAGLRYRFSAGDELDNTGQVGMGFFVMTTFENTRFNTETGLADDIDTVLTKTEQRLIFGLSAFF